MKKREEFKAPKGKFRVIGVDTFSNEDWVYGDYNSLNEAKKFAQEKGGNMNMVYVYDDQGNYKFGAGTY
jgi:hypothetical protein